MYFNFKSGFQFLRWNPNKYFILFKRIIYCLIDVVRYLIYHIGKWVSDDFIDRNRYLVISLFKIFSQKKICQTY